MLSLVRVKVRTDFLRQWFVRVGYDEDNTSLYELHTMIKEEGKYRSPSIIGIPTAGKVLKLIKPRRMLECIKLLYGRSRLSKEIRGNRLLAQIGIAVPHIYDVAYGFVPARGYDFLGYYVMDDLACQGMQDLSLLFAKPGLTEMARERVFARLIADLCRMRDHHIVFSDLTLGNVFGCEQGDVVWIDTGVTVYPRVFESRFRHKFDYSLARFLSIHRDTLLQHEKDQIVSLMYTEPR